MQCGFTRRHFLKAGGFFGLGVLLWLGGCELVPPGPSQPQLIFQQLDSGCFLNGGETVSLQGGRGKISFSGIMQTPNPCYDLQAELRTMRCGPTARCPNTYEIAITAKAQDVICIQCIGSIRYQGKIRGLAPGIYNIAVTHDGRRIASEQVQVGK